MVELSGALQKLYALAKRGSRQDLDFMRAACAREGNPQDEVVTVHVAGTNGKGSVCAMVEAMARAAGLRTGLYTSPHLVRFGERIRLNGAAVDDAVLAPVLARILTDHPQLTFFEVVTLAAFVVFRQARVDLAVLETGLGGRLDATNVVHEPLVTAITSIAYDHVEILGDSIEQIAAEKAGIIKPGVPLITGPLPLAARSVTRSRAEQCGAAPVWAVGEELTHEAPEDPTGKQIIIRGPQGRSVAASLGLAGAHQWDNAAVAVGVGWQLRAQATGLPLEDVAIARGLSNVAWAGRLELVEGRGEWSGPWLLDGAHNEHGARALAAEVRCRPVPRDALALVFGAMGDKAWGTMVRDLSPCFGTRIYVRPEVSGPARPVAPLDALLAIDPRGRAVSSLDDALAQARAAVGQEGLVVVSGSLYLVGDARARLLGEARDLAVGM